MSREADHGGDMSKQLLELNLQNAEANMGKIEGIRVSGGMTLSKHDEITTVPNRSLVLELDPEGNATGPAGSQRLFGGEAMIENEVKKVALFRKAAAAALAAPAAPDPAAPADPAAPNAQGDGAQSQPGAGSGSDPTGMAGDGDD